MALPPLPTVGGDFGAWGTILNTYLTAAATNTLAYNQITSDATVTATTEGTATAIVPGTAVTFDGATPVMIEFFCPSWQLTVNTTNIVLVLHDGTGAVGILDQCRAHEAAVEQGVIHVRTRITPTAGSKTYSVRGYVLAASTATFRAGAGGAGAYRPAFIEITRVAA